MAGQKIKINWKGTITDDMVEVLLHPKHTRLILALLEERDPEPYQYGDLERAVRGQTAPNVSIAHNLRLLRTRGFVVTGYSFTERGRELMAYINEMEKREESDTDQ